MSSHNKRGFHRELEPRFSPTVVFAGAPAAKTLPADTEGDIVPVAGGAPIPLPQKVPPAETAVNPGGTVVVPPLVKTAPATAALPTTVVLPPTSVIKPTTSLSTIKTTPATVVAPRPSTISHASLTSSSSLSTAAASSTNTASASGGASTGAIIGGIGGGLVALIGIIGLVMFLLRYLKKRKQNADAFNAAAFKRQSTALVDNTHGLNFGDPRNPAMTERNMSNTPTNVQPYSQHPYGGQQYGREQYGQEQYEQSQYSNHSGNGGTPMPDVNRQKPLPSPSISIPSSPSSPGFLPNPYGQSPNSPLQSPISPNVGAYDSQYNGQGQLLQPPPPIGAVSRVNSVASDEYDFTAHYVDLDRSSVTPYQAAQYAEISRRLNPDANSQLLSVAEGDESATSPNIADFPAVPAATHFQQQPKRRSLTRPASPDGPFADPQLAPPSSSFARDRITSSPPTLPEIERGSSYNFPVSARNSPRTANFGQDVPRGSPRTANFGQDVPRGSPRTANFGQDAPRGSPRTANFVIPAQNVPSASKGKGRAPARREEDFTDDDAYGGI